MIIPIVHTREFSRFQDPEVISRSNPPLTQSLQLDLVDVQAPFGGEDIPLPLDLTSYPTRRPARGLSAQSEVDRGSLVGPMHEEWRRLFDRVGAGTAAEPESRRRRGFGGDRFED